MVVCVCTREREREGGTGARPGIRAPRARFQLLFFRLLLLSTPKSYLVRRTAPRPPRPGRPDTRPGGTRAVGTGRPAGWGRGRGVGLGWMGVGRGRGARRGLGRGGERHSSSTQQALQHPGDGARPRPAPHDATGVPSALGSARAGCVGPGRGPPPCPCAPAPQTTAGLFLARREARKGRRTSFAARPRQGTHARGPPRRPPRQARLGVQRAYCCRFWTRWVCARCRLPVAGAAASPRQPSPRPPAIGGPSPSLSLSLPPSRPTSVHPPTARAGKRSHPAPGPALPPPPPAQAHGRKQGGDGREGRARRQRAGCMGGGRRGAGW